MRELLEAGADACSYNRVGVNPLFNAVHSGSLDTVKLLLPHYVQEDLQAFSQGFAYRYH